MLVVDDQQVVRTAVSRLATREGYTVTQAASGEEALAAITLGAFDIILLDLWMPGKNGVETLLRIRKIDGFVPIVTMSGMETDATITTCTLTGANSFLAKPFSKEVFLETVKEAQAAGARKIHSAEKGLLRSDKGYVLVADDHPGFRRAVVNRLRVEGFKVDEAATGTDAIAKASTTTYDALLLDIHMPGGSGVEVGQAIRKRDRFLPIIMMSGEATDAEIRESFRFSNTGCIQKPLDQARLAPILTFAIKTGAASKHHVRAKETFRAMPHTRQLYYKLRHRAKRVAQDPQTPATVVAILAAMMVAWCLMALVDTSQRGLIAVEDKMSTQPNLTQMYTEIRGYLQRDEERELQHNKSAG
jgi:CheY-like chemotaxis protein